MSEYIGFVLTNIHKKLSFYKELIIIIIIFRRGLRVLFRSHTYTQALKLNQEYIIKITNKGNNKKGYNNFLILFVFAMH